MKFQSTSPDLVLKQLIDFVQFQADYPFEQRQEFILIISPRIFWELQRDNRDISYFISGDAISVTRRPSPIQTNRAGEFTFLGYRLYRINTCQTDDFHFIHKSLLPSYVAYLEGGLITQTPGVGEMREADYYSYLDEIIRNKRELFASRNRQPLRNPVTGEEIITWESEPWKIQEYRDRLSRFMKGRERPSPAAEIHSPFDIELEDIEPGSLQAHIMDEILKGNSSAIELDEG